MLRDPDTEGGRAPVRARVSERGDLGRQNNPVLKVRVYCHGVQVTALVVSPGIGICACGERIGVAW